MRRGKCALRPDNKQDRHTCLMNLLSRTVVESGNNIPTCDEKCRLGQKRVGNNCVICFVKGQPKPG